MLSSFLLSLHAGPGLAPWVHVPLGSVRGIATCDWGVHSETATWFVISTRLQCCERFDTAHGFRNRWVSKEPSVSETALLGNQLRLEELVKPSKERELSRYTLG